MLENNLPTPLPQKLKLASFLLLVFIFRESFYEMEVLAFLMVQGPRSNFEIGWGGGGGHNTQFGGMGHKIHFLSNLYNSKKISSIDKRESTVGLFIDLSKAFDTVDHQFY